MPSSISDTMAEEAYTRQTKLTAAILAALAAGLTATAGTALKKGTEAAINKAVATYYDKERPGEVDRAFMAKASKRFHAKSCHMNVANQDAEQLKALLVREGVMFAVWPIPGDNGQVFEFLGRDREKAMHAADLLRGSAVRFGRVDAAALADDVLPDGKVGAIPGLSAGEFALFEHFAAKNGLRYAVTKDSGNADVIMFHPDSAEAARRTALDVGWTLSGSDGSRVREQLVYHLRGFERMTLTLREAETEAYFCCKEHPERYVHVNQEGFTLHGAQGVVHTIGRDNVDFERLAAADIMSLSGAVYLTAEQFEALSTEGIAELPTMDLLPEGYNEAAQQAELNSYMDLVQLKHSMDDEGDTPWGIGDSSVSYSEYSAFEHAQDIDKEERERGFERYKESVARVEELEPVIVESRGASLDDLIADAYRRHDEKFVESMGRGRRPAKQKETQEM